VYLVTETAGLVGAGGAAGAVADVELPVLPAADAEEEAENVRLLALVELGDVLVGTHVGFWRVIRRSREGWERSRRAWRVRRGESGWKRVGGEFWKGEGRER
jgi:hypothetical protein